MARIVRATIPDVEIGTHSSPSTAYSAVCGPRLFMALIEAAPNSKYMEYAFNNAPMHRDIASCLHHLITHAIRTVEPAHRMKRIYNEWESPRR